MFGAHVDHDVRGCEGVVLSVVVEGDGVACRLGGEGLAV
jgi:hypothetical protein